MFSHRFIHRDSRGTRVRRAISGAAALLLLATGPAAAVDGVREINQTCAVETGCFLGDAAGYPVTITRAGSYRLTGNLSREFAFGDVNDSRIEISASGATLDLNGFAIRCAELVLGGSETCSGLADGIHITGEGVTVMNGIVQGWGGDGIEAGENTVVRNVTSRLNGRWGIITGRSAIVDGCAARSNGIDGINVGVGSRVANSVTRGNAQDGIQASFGSLVEDNVSYDNASDGIVASGGSRVSRNTTRSNGGFGLSMSSEAAFDHNTVTDTQATNGGHDRGGNSCSGALCP